MSIPPSAFSARTPATENIRNLGSYIIVDQDDVMLHAPVFLPHGAVVTAAIVYSGLGGEDSSWRLLRTPVDGASFEIMATALCDVEDTSISNATIDNQNHQYYMDIFDTVNLDEFHGARITYTL